MLSKIITLFEGKIRNDPEPFAGDGFATNGSEVHTFTAFGATILSLEVKRDWSDGEPAKREALARIFVKADGTYTVPGPLSQLIC